MLPLTAEERRRIAQMPMPQIHTLPRSVRWAGAYKGQQSWFSGDGIKLGSFVDTDEEYHGLYTDPDRYSFD